MTVSHYIDITENAVFGQYSQENCCRKSKVVVYLKSTFAENYQKSLCTSDQVRAQNHMQRVLSESQISNYLQSEFI